MVGMLSVGRLLGGTILGSAFPPASLFAAGAQGVWYDPSDFSTMFQDSAGTTPVTAVEQPVGRILDKSGRGNHASQSTLASRPVLSARVNQLTYTEQFNNAAWTKTNTTVTANAAVAPDGATTADALFTTAATTIFVVGQNYTIGAASTSLIYAKASTTGFLQLTFNGDTTSYANFNLSTGVLGSSVGTVTASIQSVGSGWYKCSVLNTSTAVTGISWGIVGSATATRRQAFTATGAQSIYLWGADLRVTNDGVGLPAYQRVAAATDYDTTGFPMYLKFDGVDDSLATGSITPGADKAQVFAGIRKTSDAALAIVAELSATIASNAGSFALTAPNSAAANYNFSSKGTTQTDNTVTTYTSPLNSVLSGIADIAGASNRIRSNGATVGSVLTTQGTGNYLAYPIYIGRRGGTSNPFTGRIYSLIVRFSAANLSDEQIASTETYVNSKTGAY